MLKEFRLNCLGIPHATLSKLERCGILIPVNALVKAWWQLYKHDFLDIDLIQGVKQINHYL